MSAQGPTDGEPPGDDGCGGPLNPATPPPGVVAADRLRAELLLTELASADDLGTENLHGHTAVAVTKVARAMVDAYVAVARQGRPGFSDRFAEKSRDEFAQGKDRRTIIDQGVIRPQTAAVLTALEPLEPISAERLRHALAADNESSDLPCALVGDLAARFSQIPADWVMTGEELDARIAYGPFEPAVGPRLASRLAKRIWGHDEIPIPFDKPVADRGSEILQDPLDVDDEEVELPKAWTPGDALARLIEFLRGLPPENRRAYRELFGRVVSIGFEDLLRAFRSLARDPLPAAARDRDRQVYLAVVEMLAVHGSSGIAVAVLDTDLLAVIIAFADDGDRDRLHGHLDRIADAVGRGDLEGRTTGLLAKPVEGICNVETRLESDLRAAEIADPDLRTWLRSILDWRSDYIEAGHSQTAARRTTIYDPDQPNCLAGWFKQWARRQGRPATVLYSAVVYLAALGPGATWPDRR